MGAGPGERVSQERDMRPEVLPLQKLDEEVGEEEGKCWQRINLVPSWGLLSD